MGTVAAGVSIALHALLVGSVLLTEGGPHPREPEQRRIGAIATDEATTMTMIFIDEPGADAQGDEPLESMRSDGGVLQDIRVPIAIPLPKLDSSRDGADDAREAEAPAESVAAVEDGATLSGRYLAQIRARVERAWVRPRTPIGAESFECRVQLLQSASGELVETTLQRCNGDARWQLSLVHALERASPLPAPPDPKVFADSVQLSFRSAAYGAGEDESNFESPGFPAIP